MTRLLLDANQSPRTSIYLRETFSFDVADLWSLGLLRLPDSEVVELGKTDRRVVITEDLHFGGLYNSNRGQVGIIIMRLEFQSTASVNRLLHRFFTDSRSRAIDLYRSLILLDDERDRIRGTLFPIE